MMDFWKTFKSLFILFFIQTVTCFENDNSCAEKVDLHTIQNALLLLAMELQALRMEITSVRINISSRVEAANVGISNLEREFQNLREHQEQTSSGRDFQDFLKKVMSNPQAKLYNQEGLKGNQEAYDFSEVQLQGGCYDLKTLKGQVKSLETFGSCVRIFAQNECHGWSQAIYPGSNNNKNNSIRIPTVSSVGPCIATEFDNSSLTTDLTTRRKTLQKGPMDFPDIFDISGQELWDNSTTVTVPSNPVRKFLQGANGRVEYIFAIVRKKHLKCFPISLPTEDRACWENLGNGAVSNNVVGYGIPPQLGGPLNETYNRFPLTMQGSMRWMLLTSEVASFLNEGSLDSVPIRLIFLYRTEQDSIPFAFTYHFYFDGSRTVYGLLQNN